MMLYAESSAVLAWLLDEPAGTIVRTMLSEADVVIASDLTLIECDRVIHRATALGELTEAEAANRCAQRRPHEHHMRMPCSSSRGS